METTHKYFLFTYTFSDKTKYIHVTSCNEKFYWDQEDE